MRRILILVLVVALAGVPKVGALAPQVKLKLEPAEVTVGLHETFTVQVMIEGASDLGAFEFDLTYDPSILRFEGATVGEFIRSTGRSVVPVGPEVDGAGGRVTLGAISYGNGDGDGPSGTGVLVTITFVAQGEGSTALEMSKVQVLDTAVNVQPITVAGGRVVVSGAAAPAPVASATPKPTGTPATLAAPTTAPAPLPSPTPSITEPPSAGGTRLIVLGSGLAVLAAIILAILILRRRPKS